jgi:hypothetical protein
MNKPHNKEKASKKKEIEYFAKNLFLTPAESDKTKHKYSFREIIKQIEQSLNTSVSIGTISNWAKNKGWEELWKQGQRHGVQKAIEGNQGDKDNIDEIYENRISMQVAKQLKQIDDNTTLACEIINNELKRILQEQKDNPNKKLAIMRLKVISDIAQNGNEIINEKNNAISSPTLIQINVDVADDGE